MGIELTKKLIIVGRGSGSVDVLVYALTGGGEEEVCDQKRESSVISNTLKKVRGETRAFRQRERNIIERESSAGSSAREVASYPENGEETGRCDGLLRKAIYSLKNSRFSGPISP